MSINTDAHALARGNASYQFSSSDPPVDAYASEKTKTRSVIIHEQEDLGRAQGGITPLSPL